MSVQLEHYLPFFPLVFFGKINGGPDQTLPTTTAREDALIKSTTLESIKSEQPRRQRVNKSPLTSCLVCSDRLAACFHTIGCGIRVDQSFSPRTLFAARIVLNGQRLENCYWSDGVKISTSHFFLTFQESRSLEWFVMQKSAQISENPLLTATYLRLVMRTVHRWKVTLPERGVKCCLCCHQELIARTVYLLFNLCSWGVHLQGGATGW